MSHLRELDMAAVRRAWTQFCVSGEAGHLREIPPDVAASWQRSRAHGVDPGLRLFPMRESIPRWDQDERALLQVIERAVVSFKRELRDSRALLAVIAASGRIIFREGNVSTLRAADTIGSIPGALALESAGGTNSAGTTLYRNDFTWIHGWAHYCEAFWEWSDIGAPIVHPVTGVLLGLVDIGLPGGPVTPALALASKAIVGSIQREILTRESALSRALLKRWSRNDPGPHQVVLAVDRYGSIVCASDGAKRMLASGPEGMCGRSLSGIPELQEIDRALASGAGGTYTVGLGKDRRQTRITVEPALEFEEIVGFIIHFDQVPTRSNPRTSAWESRYSFSEVFGESRAFKPVLALAKRLAGTELPVLLHGETGTGKELIAHAIHAASERAAGPFVTVNCGAIPQELIASELFGYEKGAFTGANRAGQRGKFEQADGGTIFLDEITETCHALQVSLLRVIQDCEVVPVGADKARRVDVRIISATNRDPAQAMSAGTLRSDLYYRLNGAVIALPPLRERREDIPPLVARFCAESGRDIGISPPALALLLAHDWPGNLRELHAVIRSAALLAEGTAIELHDLPAAIGGAAAASTGAQSGEVRLDLKTAEVAAIERAMAASHGNVKEAAALLGIGRSSLYRKLKYLQMTRTWTWK